MSLSVSYIKSILALQHNKKKLHRIVTYLQIIAAISILILIYGCCAASADVSKYENVQILAKQKYERDYFIIENEPGTFVLCYKKYEKKNQPHTLLEYFVYDLNKKEIIFDEKINDADVKWYDENNLEIRITPEIISSDDETYVFLLNILSGKKQKLNY